MTWLYRAREKISVMLMLRPSELTTELGARPGQPDHRPGHPAIEIAIYPDIIGLAARNLRARDTVRGAAP